MKVIFLLPNKNLIEKAKESTSDIRAEEAVPRLLGSIDSKVSSKPMVDSGKSMHLSRRELS